MRSISVQFRMSGLKQKRSDGEVENQLVIKKSRESICYDDFSPSLLEINTQPIDEKKEERKIFSFPPSYFSEKMKPKHYGGLISLLVNVSESS